VPPRIRGSSGSRKPGLVPRADPERRARAAEFIEVLPAEGGATVQASLTGGWSGWQRCPVPCASPRQESCAVPFLADADARRRQWRGALTSAAVTLAVLLPVAIAVGDHGWVFSLVALVMTCSLVFVLCALLPHGPVFALSVVTALAVYICLFVVIGRSAFPTVLWWAEPLAFSIPILGFIGTCWLQRARLSAPMDPAAELEGDFTHLPRFSRWFALCAVVGVLCVGLPFNRLSPELQAVVLVLAMSVVTVLTMLSVHAVLLLLADVAGILGFVATRLRFLAAPMLTYTLLFSLLTVFFGCAYRIADGISRKPLFQKLGEVAKLTFSEALHFSIVTLATVGYGDILPHDDGVRLLATIQMLLGQLLLLFGFAEIVRDRLQR
jgi:hypothetical protein